MSIRTDNTSNYAQGIAFGLGGGIAIAGIVLFGCGLEAHATSAIASGIAIAAVGAALIAGAKFYDRLKQAKEKIEKQAEEQKIRNNNQSEGNIFIYDRNL